jgi:integrase
MGDKSGVRARSKSSIEIDFYYRGIRCRERIKRPPTPANIKYAAKLKSRIEHEIATNDFNYEKHFPESKNLQRVSRLPGAHMTLKAYFESWLENGASQSEAFHLGGISEGFQVSSRPFIRDSEGL